MRGSIQDLPVAVEIEEGQIRQIDWGGMTVELGTLTTSIDPSPFFQGLPDDRCQCPHWGYVIKGQLRYRFADREEVYNTGDVYYAAPGHLPVIGDDTAYVEFSPTEQLQQTMEVVERNFQAAMSPSA